MSRLHIICGNCGSKDDLHFRIEPNGLDFGTRREEAVYIVCDNCGTLHTLDENMPQTKEEK